MQVSLTNLCRKETFGLVFGLKVLYKLDFSLPLVSVLFSFIVFVSFCWPLGFNSYEKIIRENSYDLQNIEEDVQVRRFFLHAA